MPKRFGISCEVADEAALGHVLAFMKMNGADNIGFEVLAVEQPVKRVRVHAIAPPQGKTVAQAIIDFIRGRPLKGEFRMKDVLRYLEIEGFRKRTGLSMMEFMETGMIERVSTGLYRRRH